MSTIQKYPDPPRPHIIRSVADFFPTLESGLKNIRIGC